MVGLQSEISTDPPSDVGKARRFTVGDAMILTAAVALALTLDRRAPLALLQGLGDFDPRRAGGWTRAIIRLGSPLNNAAIPVLIFATPALLLLRIRRPRLPIRLLLRQPGAVACGVASIAVAALFAGSGLIRLPEPSIFAPGVSVTVAWIVLALARRWEAEPGWVDRSGRAVGVLWIATMPWFAWLGSN